MAEYMSREAAFNAITDLAGKAQTRSAYEAVWKSARALKKLPAADVAPVVRCNDCKHLVAVNVNGKGIPTCRVSGMKVAPDEFCSRGEKGRR